MLKSTIMVIGTAFVLAGCSTAAQQEFNRLSNITQSTEHEAASCFEAIKADTKFTPLDTKFYLGDSPTPPLSYLTNKELPSKSELTMVETYYEAIRNCRNIKLKGAQDYNYRVYEVFVDCSTKSDTVVMKFLDGKTSWGEFNKTRTDLNNSCRQRASQINAQIVGELEASNQVETQQRAAAWQRASTNFQQQQYLNSLNRPINTNCMAMGNMVNCTTR